MSPSLCGSRRGRLPQEWAGRYGACEEPSTRESRTKTPTRPPEGVGRSLWGTRPVTSTEGSRADPERSGPVPQHGTNEVFTVESRNNPDDVALSSHERLALWRI